MEPLSEHPGENVKKWDRRAMTYDHRRFDYFRFMQKKTIKKMRIKDNMTFLDLGCGTGWAVRYMSNLTHGNGNFWGIDISGGMIEKTITNSQVYKNV